jgi:hypothetical protein
VRLQKLSALRVAVPLVGKTVLAAVQLDIQPRFLAKEIKVVNAPRVLTAEFVTGETPSAQPAPDKFSRPSLFFCEAAGRV